MARTNVLTTAKRIRRQLGPGHRQEIAQLLTAVDDVSMTIAFAGTALPTSVDVGITLGIDLELVRVISVNVSANSCQVIRGFLDSDPVAHAAGAQIDVAPRFSNFDIVSAMMSEIDSWGSQLYYTLATTFPLALSAQTLELPSVWSNLLGIVAASQSEILSSVGAGVTSWPEMPLRMVRGTAAGFTGAPTSGVLLRFTEPIRSGQVFLVVAMQFSSAGMLPTQDLVTDFHLSNSMLDILEMGTKRRLILDSDAARGSRVAQDEARRSEETPYGSMVSLDQLQLGQYRLRKAEEVRLLRRFYPIRIT